jgi:hypothetical protein
MSTLVETYALSCGVPIDKPFMNEAFFPTDTPLDKIILVHAFAGASQDQNGKKIAAFPAKIYEYYQEVIDILKPFTDKLQYKFYQIGAAGEPSLVGVENLCGKTTMHQCNYLIKRAALLIGNDSMWAHIRGAEKKPLVILYGSTSKPHFPYWRNPENSYFIESHRGGNKPSYSSNENPKTINLITPEEVANSALKALKIEKSSCRKSVYIGPDYLSPIVEFVPNAILNPALNVNAPIIARMDYNFNEEVLEKNLSFRKMLIISNKEINPNILFKYKSQILSLRIEIDNVSQDWIKQVKKTAIKTDFFSTEKDEAKLKKLRLEYYDSAFFTIFTPPSKEDFKKIAAIYLNKPLDNGFNFDNLKFRSKKILISDGKIFLSKAHWKKNISADSSENNISNVIDDPDFWEDLAHYYFFTE